MDVGTISIVLVLGLIFLLAIGMPLGFASAVLALLVMVMKFEPTLLTDPFSFGEGLLTRSPGTGPLYILTQKIFDLLTEYVLISVPLFIFMAALLERSGVARAMYDSLDFWLSRVRGGIAIVTSVMAVILAAMSGIIGGFLSIVVVGLSALLFLRALVLTMTGLNADLPEHKDSIFLGMSHHLPWLAATTAAGVALILFGFGRERSRLGWQHGKGLVPPLIVISIVLGSIYGGVTGITEAAGMGALAVFLIALVRGEASVGLVWDSLMRTLRSTGTIIWVTVGAAALSGAYTLAGGPAYIAELIVGAEMPTLLVLLTMMVILLFMGAFMDWVGIVLLIIPVFLPIVKRLPIEEIGFFGQLAPQHVAIWFGVLFCMNMQVSFLSPPFGPAAFYLKSVAPPHISLTDIFRGFLPFIAVQLVALCVLLAWPPIVTLLF